MLPVDPSLDGLVAQLQSLVFVAQSSVVSLTGPGTIAPGGESARRVHRLRFCTQSESP